MRLIDNAIFAVLLHITQPSFATLYQQRQPFGTIFSGCGSCDFADFTSSPSRCREPYFNIRKVPFAAFKSA
jgi:hypothetical protein